MDEPVPPTSCSVNDKSAIIDQIEDVSNLMPGDFIEVFYGSGPDKTYVSFVENSGATTNMVEVLKVEGVITIGVVIAKDRKITNVTAYHTPGGGSGDSRLIIDEFFKEGDYIMVEDRTGGSPVTFGSSLSKFVRVKSIDRVGLNLNLEESANSGTLNAIIRVNRCFVNARASVANRSLKGYISWRKAIFSSVILNKA